MSKSWNVIRWNYDGKREDNEDDFNDGHNLHDDVDQSIDHDDYLFGGVGCECQVVRRYDGRTPRADKET